MSQFYRTSRFGRWQKQRGSAVTQERFQPGANGWNENEDVTVPADSIVSGANVWVDDSCLQPRWRLEHVGGGATDVIGDVVNGAVVYYDLDGTEYNVAMSQDTIAFLQADGSWTTLQYASGTSDLQPTGDEMDLYFGATVYLPRTDENLLAFCNGVDPVYCWQGPSGNTAFSVLTQAPIARDMCVFDNRPVCWNIRELFSASRYVTRVQWPPAGAPENWSTASIGAGFEDLLDARGEGTRIFAQEDQMVLATTRELWRGRKVGLPYVFSFTPIERSRELSVGIPYRKAAIQTPLGIFWLGADFMIYHMQDERITPIGAAIWDTLRTTLKAPERAFFGYSSEQGFLSFYYSVTDGAYPTRSFVYNVERQHWTPQTFPHNLTYATPIKVTSSSDTWGDVSGTVAAQTKTWNEFLGLTLTQRDGVFTSGGTQAYFSPSAGSDLGDTVESVIATGAIFAGDMDRMKLMDEARVDMRATSASSLSIAVSGNLGSSYADTEEFSLSVQSQTTQVKINPMVSGAYHAMRFRSEDTGWRLTRCQVHGRDIGKVT